MILRFRTRAVLIDLDGTLVDSLPDIACAANSMRQELGLSPLMVKQIASYVGKGVDVLVHRALTETMDGQASPDLFERGRQVFNRCYSEINGNESHVYPGVQQALEDLRSKALPLACVTNKPRSFTLQLLERTNLKAAFSAVVSGDDTEQKKPHGAPMLRACQLLGVTASDATVIGDSENDALAARAAGCRVIIVETGYNEGKSLVGLDADAIVPTLLHAARLIESQSL
ncbi:MAG: phosphoglycolate phosphatase [Pseudomonadota bacterium]|nr:phosphoglycolate phosphatase [Pseudomonadota bacterium]